MSKYIISILILVLLSIGTKAQRNRWKEHNFKLTTELSTVKPKYQNEDAVEIKNVKLFEYKSFAGGTLQKTVYKLIKINTNIGLESYNKVAIPMYGVKDIIDVEVRFISSKGKVTSLTKDDLYELKNLEGYGDFTVFAIKGAEVGGEIEYKYTVFMYPTYSHLEIYYNTFPIQEAIFELVAPSNYKIFIKGYNGFPVFTIDNEGRKAWYAHLEDIEPFEREKKAANTANRMKVGYAVLGNGAYRYSNTIENAWMNRTEFIHGSWFGFTDLELKKARKLYRTFPLENSSKEQKIEYIRKFSMDSIQADPLIYNDLYNIIKKRKSRNNYGKVLLQAALYQVAGISFEMVETSDKYHSEFTDEYPFSFNVDKLLMYFPNLKLFLDPINQKYPIGIIPAQYIERQGYFVNFLGNYRFDQIQSVDTSRTQEYQYANISIDSNSIVHIHSEVHKTGYFAAQSRTHLSYLNKTATEEYLKGVAIGNMEDAKLLQSEVLNDSLSWDINPPPPLKYKFDLRSDMLFSKAGNNLLFHIGHLLKPQVNFYQENEREQAIIMGFPYKKEIIIQIEIPLGYTPTNLAILNDSIQYLNSNNEMMASLITSYHMEGNKLTYKIVEWMTKGEFVVEEYINLRTIVNTIADLKYKTLILTVSN